MLWSLVFMAPNWSSQVQLDLYCSTQDMENCMNILFKFGQARTVLLRGVLCSWETVYLGSKQEEGVIEICSEGEVKEQKYVGWGEKKSHFVGAQVMTCSRFC